MPLLATPGPVGRRRPALIHAKVACAIPSILPGDRLRRGLSNSAQGLGWDVAHGYSHA